MRSLIRPLSIFTALACVFAFAGSAFAQTRTSPTATPVKTPPPVATATPKVTDPPPPSPTPKEEAEEKSAVPDATPDTRTTPPPPPVPSPRLIASPTMSPKVIPTPKLPVASPKPTARTTKPVTKKGNAADCTKCFAEFCSKVDPRYPYSGQCAGGKQISPGNCVIHGASSNDLPYACNAADCFGKSQPCRSTGE